MSSVSSKSIHHLLNIWSNEPSIRSNIVVWHEEPEAYTQSADFPEDLFPPLRDYLVSEKGISHPYLHQANAWSESVKGNNVVVVSGTASGKTLCYNLPVLNRAFRDPESRTLYLFPTKALTQDQYQGLLDITTWRGLPANTPAVPVSVYDGDTPVNNRPAIRSKVRLAA